MKVTVALAPEQTVAFEAIEAVGTGKTVITTDPVTFLVQLGFPAETTLTNVYVVVAV